MPANFGNPNPTPNFNALLMEGFNTGREMKRQDGVRNALADLMTEAPGQTPGYGDGIEAERRGSSALADLARYDPQMAFQIQDHRQKQQLDQQQFDVKQQDAAREQMVTVGRLLDGVTDENSYQQGLAAARQLGIDLSRAPASYDPNWTNQQRMIVNAYTKDSGQSLSGIARELVDAGYQPGTSQFEQAMAGVINNKYASEYVDEGGNIRRRSALNLPETGGSQQQDTSWLSQFTPEEVEQMRGLAMRRSDAANMPAGDPLNPTGNELTVGKVVNGFRYKGGDPSTRSSWEVTR